MSRISLCVIYAITALIGTSLATQSLAKEQLDKLQDFRQTGTALEMETVLQGGSRANRINKTLERIKLPPGFKIHLYAIVPDARHMAVGTNVGVVFVGTRKTKFWAVTDRDSNESPP